MFGAAAGHPMLAGLVPLVIVAVTFAIVVVCVLWMRSTRASQRRVDEQNERIIRLLEEIAANTKQG